MKHICRLLLILLANPLMAAVITKWDFSSDCKDYTVRDKGYIKDNALEAANGYMFGAFYFNPPSENIRFTCKAQALKGDEFGSFGAIIYRIAGNKWEQIKNIGWKKRLLFDKEKEIVFKAPAELFKNKPGRYVLALFRNSGGVRISQIVMEKEQTSSATPSNEDFLRQKAMSDGNTISPLPQRRHEYVEGTGDSLKLDYFPMGIYYYSSSQTIRTEEAMRQMLQELQDAGVNTIHFAGNTGLSQQHPMTSIPNVAKLAEKYNIFLWCQMNDVYYRRNNYAGLNNYKAKNSLEYLKKYAFPRIRRTLPLSNDLSAVYAWLPCEEADHDDVDRLALYRKKIWEISPRKRIFELFNKNTTLAALRSPLPNIAGVDRYSFRYEAKEIQFPQQGLAATRWSIRYFFNQSQKIGLPMIGVIQGSAMHSFISGEEMTGGLKEPEKYEKFAVKSQGIKYYPRSRKFGYWSMYAPPKNGIRVQAWQMVAEGAKGILIFSYSPLSYEVQRKNAEQKIQNEIGGKENVSIRLCSSNKVLWDDMRQTFADLKPFGNLLIDLEKLPERLFSCDNPVFYGNSFRDSQGRRYSIIVNTHIVDIIDEKNVNINSCGVMTGIKEAAMQTGKIQSSLPMYDLKNHTRITDKITLEPGEGIIICHEQN